MTVLLGAVAYDPKVVSIWNGFRAWLEARDLAFDFVLYSNYERQVEDLLAGRLDTAWNSPLAWIRARRLAAAHGQTMSALLMRDTDRDLTSLIVVRADSPYEKVSDLAGQVVGVGAVDSPQARLIPVSFLRSAGLIPGENVQVRRFDVGVGLHGDHIGGERHAVRALLAGEIEAAAIIDSNHLLFGREGTVPAGRTRVLACTPAYDHCNLSAVGTPPQPLLRLRDELLAMSYTDPTVRPLFDLEGLTSWQPGRESGYGLLEDAVDEDGFYAADGSVTAREYRP